MKPNARADAFEGELNEGSLPVTPLHLIMKWTREALDRAEAVGDVCEPLALNVATVDTTGAPHLRIVLMRYLDGRGPGFVSHLGSRKAIDLAACPKVAASLDWLPMYRTIRFQGLAERVDDLEVIDAWQQRTWEAQIAATASEQSKPIEGREEFDLRLETARLSYPRGSAVPMPESFAGWRIRCSSVEFWSGRADRSHDRLVMTNPSDLELDNPGWNVTRLMP